MSEEVLNNLFELRNLEDDKARKYTLYRKIEKYITNLQQENKQLKSILTELEEWLKEQQERYRDYLSTRPKNDSEYNSKYATQCGLSQVDVILDKIQELKEKYK